LALYYFFMIFKEKRESANVTAGRKEKVDPARVQNTPPTHVCNHISIGSKKGRKRTKQRR